MLRRSWAAGLLVAACLTMATGTADPAAGDQPTGDGLVAVLNGLPVPITIGGALAARLEPHTRSATTLLPARPQRLEIRSASGSADVMISPVAGRSQSMVVSRDRSGQLRTRALDDELAAPGAGRIAVRLVNVTDLDLGLAVASVNQRPTAAARVTVTAPRVAVVRADLDAVLTELGLPGAHPGQSWTVLAARTDDGALGLHPILDADGPDLAVPDGYVHTGAEPAAGTVDVG